MLGKLCTTVPSPREGWLSGAGSGQVAKNDLGWGHALSVPSSLSRIVAAGSR